MERKGFFCYNDFLDAIGPLDDAERGRLFTICLLYTNGLDIGDPAGWGNERYVWPMLKSRIDRDFGKAQAISTQRNGARQKAAGVPPEQKAAGVPPGRKPAGVPLEEDRCHAMSSDVASCQAMSPDVTPCHAMSSDVPLEPELELELDNPPKTTDVVLPPKGGHKRRFVRPTVEQVAEYCRSRGNSVDPQRFCDYYEANGWRVGKNPMRDWRAAVRTWERNSAGPGSRSPGNPFLQMLEGGE